jgi:hypothetical protein
VVDEPGESIYWRLFLRYSGILAFLALVAFLNILLLVIQDPFFQAAVRFLNDALWILFMVSFFAFISAVFGRLPFPLNLPSPVFAAIGGVLLVSFLIRVLVLSGSIIGVNLAPLLHSITLPLLFSVLAAILVVGYVRLLRPVVLRAWHALDTPEYCRIRRNPTREEKEGITWDDVQVEFRYALYDILRHIREEMHSEER